MNFWKVILWNSIPKWSLLVIFFLPGIFWLFGLGNWLLPGLGIFDLEPCGIFTVFVFRGDRGISGGANCPHGRRWMDSGFSFWKNQENIKQMSTLNFFDNQNPLLTFPVCRKSSDNPVKTVIPYYWITNTGTRPLFRQVSAVLLTPSFLNEGWTDFLAALRVFNLMVAVWRSASLPLDTRGLFAILISTAKVWEYQEKCKDKQFFSKKVFLSS